MTDPTPVPSPRPTSVKAVRNGPSSSRARSGSWTRTGEEYDLEGRRIVLVCRCGSSANQPFCDSSHKRSGRVSQDQPSVCDGSDDGAA